LVVVWVSPLLPAAINAAVNTAIPPTVTTTPVIVETPPPVGAAPFDAPPAGSGVPAASGSAARLAQEKMHRKTAPHVSFIIVFLPLANVHGKYRAKFEPVATTIYSSQICGHFRYGNELQLRHHVLRKA
jgi:hypothetical protein